MKISQTLAATAVVTAALTIPAMADTRADDDEAAAFVSCLRAKGLDIPAGAAGAEIKLWVSAREHRPEVQDAMQRCGGDVESKPAAAPGPAPAELLACLRARGLNPPTAMHEFKRWADGTDGAALKACGLTMKQPACGEHAQDKPPAAKALARSGS